MSNHLTLVTGGARSGKSRYAQEQADALARASEQGRVLFIATAESTDDEMHTRIERHRNDRPSHWHTLEAARGAAGQLRTAGPEYDVIVLDCLTLFVSNILVDLHDQQPATIEAQIDTEIDALCEAARSVSAPVLFVTNEVGMGIHPLTALGRLFQDLAGRANQRVAAAADEVILMVCGIPLKVKGGS